jgi:hypothetical protein
VKTTKISIAGQVLDELSTTSLPPQRSPSRKKQPPLVPAATAYQRHSVLNQPIVVLVSSRPSGDGDQFKYSYHAIVTNVVMQKNNDGAMKQLLRIGMGDC